ncbi:MAG: DegT/DnrJ/EryC1/StrS family aminotransferase [Candidatus Omnitrophica bacterium]|nr:DegT/DnrJ/EryC1/StrS family aminotransferase [Candidatus Omnitrophota bacterium]
MAGNTKIHLLDLKREYAFLKKDIAKETKKCFATQSWILGEQLVTLETALTGYLNTKYALGVASGTDALLIALRTQAFRLKKKGGFFDAKDEIITTPFTFVATAEVITRAGATPVFVDIDPATFNISPSSIKRAITQNTKGIIPVHLYGLGCAMDEILKIAKTHNLFIVEDVAQSFGASYKGTKLGTLGDAGCFSFFPSKNLGAYGDGGLVATDDDMAAILTKALRNHGQLQKYDAAYIGYNSRLDSFQAAVLLAKLKHIDRFNELRNNVAQKYARGLARVTQVQLPLVPKNHTHVYNLYNIMVPADIRDALLKHLGHQGIESRVYYPIPLHKMGAFCNARRVGTLENTEKASLGILSLPLNPFLQDGEIKYVIKAIGDFFSL